MGRGLLPAPLCALLRHTGVGSREQVQLPFPITASPSLLGGGRPLGPGGAEGRACGPPAGVGAGGGGGGWGGRPPARSRACVGGGGEWGGPFGSLATPPDGQGGGGGRHGSPGPGGQPSAGGSRPSPAPLYLVPDPRAGPRWGPSSPRPLSRGAGRPGVAVRVSGQWLAGCGAAGSPPRSLSPRSLPREVARSLASCRTVGGAWVGGPSPPPQLSRIRRLGHHLRRRLCGGWGCGGGGLCRR